MVAGHTGRTKPLDQFRRAGQRVGQDLDHGLLDLSGGEPPALRAIRSGIGDQCSGDVVAVASALLDGVCWRDRSPRASTSRPASKLGSAALALRRWLLVLAASWSRTVDQLSSSIRAAC